MLAGDAQKKKINLVNLVQADIIVRADNNMLATVIRNLLTNAIKFTRPGGEVSVSNSRENGLLEFIFQDNGVGIAAENIDKLFNIDTKVATKGTADEPGTGLGLILCREFIEKNSGTIRVESEVGKGSRFIITLPAPTT